MSLTKKFNIIFFSLMMAWLSLMPVQMVLAAEPTGVDKAKSGLEVTAKAGGVQASQTDLPTIIGKIVGAVLAFVGVIFFCLILWAGFGWMLAKGNEEEIKQAKETIFSAVLGLMVILGAYAVTRLIALIFNNALTGT